jgi:hypothetical protein
VKERGHARRCRVLGKPSGDVRKLGVHDMAGHIPAEVIERRVNRFRGTVDS